MWLAFLTTQKEAMVSHNLWIFVVFAVYVAIVFVFAITYHEIFKRSPRSFAFNADVLRRQSELFKTATDKEVAKIETNLAILSWPSRNSCHN